MKKGYYITKKQIKANVKPVDNVTKFGYEPEDFESVKEFVEYSESELKEKEYEDAKKSLKETDYVALKAIENLLCCTDITELFKTMIDFKNEHAEILNKRKEWRQKIKEIERDRNDRDK